MNKVELVSVLVICASALVVSVNLLGGPATPSSEPPPPDPVTEEREEIERLEAELLRVRARCAVLEKRLEPASDPAEPDPAPTPDVPKEPEEVRAIPEAVRRSAERLGVAEPALRAAFELEMATRERRSAVGLLDKLIAQGDQGFLAVVALIRGGLRATWQRVFLEKTYRPGLERHLIALAEDPDAASAHATALSFLSVADTEEVRLYLVTRAGREADPALLYGAAESLADLKEPRGAAAFEGKFIGESFGGVRPMILGSLGRMGGPDAARILIDYLRDEHADNVHTAIAALARVEPEAAAAEAKRILVGPRARFLDGRTLTALRRAAGVK